jgi:hypothetical protein
VKVTTVATAIVDITAAAANLNILVGGTEEPPGTRMGGDDAIHRSGDGA